MEEVWKQVTTPTFWLCTVVVGVLINFVSQWLYGPLTGLPRRWFAWSRKRSESRRAQIARDVEMLVRAPHLVSFYVARGTNALLLTAFSGLVFLVLWQSPLFTQITGSLLSSASLPLWQQIGFPLLFLCLVFLAAIAVTAFNMTGVRLEVLNEAYAILASRVEAEEQGAEAGMSARSKAIS